MNRVRAWFTLVTSVAGSELPWEIFPPHRLFFLLCLQPGFGGGLEFLQLRFEFPFRVADHPVYEKNSVEMICFMLHHARQQATATELDGFAFWV